MNATLMVIIVLFVVIIGALTATPRVQHPTQVVYMQSEPTQGRDTGWGIIMIILVLIIVLGQANIA